MFLDTHTIARLVPLNQLQAMILSATESNPSLSDHFDAIRTQDAHNLKTNVLFACLVYYFSYVATLAHAFHISEQKTIPNANQIRTK